MLKKYFNIFIKSLLRKKFLSFLYIFCYILGIVLGVVLRNKEDLEIIYIVKNFHNITLGLFSSPFKLMFTRLLNNFFYFVIIYFFCYKMFFCIFNLTIFLYRGVVLGSVSIIFFQVLGVEGIILYVFLVVVQNVLVSFCLFYTTIILYYLKSNCKNKYTDNIFLKYLFVGYIMSLMVIVYELLFLLLILRPLNIYF